MMAFHINELTIQSLRGIKHLSLPQLGNVNLLVGNNNCGKTTVLEAISLFCRPLDPLEWLAVARRRTVKSSRESLLEGVRWLFPQDKADLDDPYYEGEVRIEGQGAFPCLESSAHFSGFGEDDDDSSSSEWDEDEDESSFSDYEDEEESSGSGDSMARGADIDLSVRVPPDGQQHKYEFELFEDERFIRREPPEGPTLPVATITPFSHRVEQLQVKGLSKAQLKGRKANVLECLKLTDPGVEELEILSPTGVRPMLYIHHSTTGYTPLYTLGDGVRRIVTMALALIKAQNGVLLIDEIETAIHRDALMGVFRWLVQAAEHYQVQLFATTHSLEAVDAILESSTSLQTGTVGYRLQQTEQGTTAKRYDGEMLHRLRYERGLDVR